MDEKQKIMIGQLAQNVIQSLFEAYYGHAGRHGEVGGSAPRGAGGAGGGRKRISPLQAAQMIQTSRGMSKRRFDMLWKRSREGSHIPIRVGWR